MRILVVGPGAIGNMFAGMLTLGGHDVWLLGRRREPVDAINRDGVTIEQVWKGTTLRTPVRATLDAQDAGIVELVMMCVKSTGTLKATQDAVPAVGDGTVVLTVQNGLGNVEAMASVVGRERVLAGVTVNGITLMGPGVIRHAAMGETTIGELDGRTTERAQMVAEVLRQAGITAAVSSSVDSLLWGKLVPNASLNPLAALLRVRNGQLIERPDAKALLGAVAREVVAVAEAKGVRLPYPDPIERVEATARKMASNKMSMLQDMERGIPTEVDYINGAVVREGEAAGVRTPINWTLWHLVKAMEAESQPTILARQGAATAPITTSASSAARSIVAS